ncbi:MAG: hypothetical protein NTV54_06155 [Ignavibacteriales bacterium]|nr:hypothetical protein [Ignavibacteriales bacterium]
MIRFRNTGWLIVLIALCASVRLCSQTKDDCLTCHSDKTLSTKKGSATISLFVDEKKYATSVHGVIECVGCHSDLKGKDFPHEQRPQRPTCLGCHDKELAKYAGSLHGKAVARGDALAPRCPDCHGSHAIVPVRDSRSNVAPMQIPYLCGRCHREGTPVTRQHQIPQSSIFENYSESIHGEGLLKKGLAVSATCVSCHSSHDILPHTDARSSIARKNIAATCSRCHTMIEQVHRKIIKGALWEKEEHVLPACVDCHQPHKVRKVFYDQGMANQDCLRCHDRPDIRSSKDGHSLAVKFEELTASRHVKVACTQCHTGVSPSKLRPCQTIQQKVDCASCHAVVGDDYNKSIHGKLSARNDQNAPVCKECHGTHKILGKKDPASPIFSLNIPQLCARCHREGKKAAVRYKGEQHEIIEHYTESIHGKGLLKSGLTVTATCTDCHTAHRELPKSDSASSINPANTPATCGRCHHGIEEKFRKSVHSSDVTKTSKPLPVCNDCHSAHTIRRTDDQGFKLSIMNTCGRCHEKISETYFDTYHGKVSQLGYAKTAKCYDCHGSHDVLRVSDPESRLSHANVVATCQQCHPGATRRFAGYLTHATHHDPAKYPLLFWTFWGMTSLLIGTFVLGAVHTLLWLPRALQMRRQRRRHMESKE